MARTRPTYQVNDLKIIQNKLDLKLTIIVYYSTGDKWKRHRKLLTPAFHFKILDSFFPVMNDNTKEMMARFEKIVSKDETEHRGIDIRQLVGDCTLDTICGKPLFTN